MVFARALEDMFPLAKTILKGRLARDECRGAHYKPEFAMPEIDGRPTRPSGVAQAEDWCRRFEENNRKWLKTTIATVSPEGEPQLSYEEVDTSLVPPAAAALRRGGRGSDRASLERSETAGLEDEELLFGLLRFWSAAINRPLGREGRTL